MLRHVPRGGQQKEPGNVILLSELTLSKISGRNLSQTGNFSYPGGSASPPPPRGKPKLS